MATLQTARIYCDSQVLFWMVSCNGPSYFPEGQVYLESSLAHPPGQSLREYFAERLNFIWDASIEMVSILMVPFKAEWQFLQRKKDPIYTLAKKSRESHPFFRKIREVS